MINDIQTDQAFTMVKFITSKTGKTIKFKDAMYLAGFSFPLERKLRVIERVIKLGRAGSIYSALYFRSAFQEAEVSYHKGPLPDKNSLPAPISDILSSIRLS